MKPQGTHNSTTKAAQATVPPLAELTLASRTYRLRPGVAEPGKLAFRARPALCRSQQHFLRSCSNVSSNWRCRRY